MMISYLVETNHLPHYQRFIGTSVLLTAVAHGETDKKTIIC